MNQYQAAQLMLNFIYKHVEPEMKPLLQSSETTIAIFLLLFFKQYITSFEQLATWVEITSNCCLTTYS